LAEICQEVRRNLAERKKRDEMVARVSAMSDSKIESLSRESDNDLLHAVAKELWTERQEEKTLLQQLPTMADSDLERLVIHGSSVVVRQRAQHIRNARARAAQDARRAAETKAQERIISQLPQMPDLELESLCKQGPSREVREKASAELRARKSKREREKKAREKKAREERARLEASYRSLAGPDLFSLIQKGECDIDVAFAVLLEKSPLAILTDLANRGLPDRLARLVALEIGRRKPQTPTEPRRGRQRGGSSREPRSWDDAVGPDWWRVQGE
jgi:hypothetical protein